jgi:Asp-tRNA(Asn)/Glu-tRNA(Gln) amidotransferase A subunit family amidase
VTELVAGPFTGISLTELGRRLRAGEADPVEVVERALAAIEAAQPSLNAFVTVDADGARSVAVQRRDELARGVDHGPLHGVPVAVKDLLDTAGLTTTMGSRHFAGNVPGRDADAVARLRAAGAVIVGKTTTHEFAYGPTGDVAANGAAVNPHDPGRMAGGSSAGSAVAVAAGLVPLALGTDTGGSVRIPAALCGIAGLRPSFGRISTAGAFPLSWSLDTVGPLAASVADIRVWLTGTPTPAPRRQFRLGVPVDAWFDRVDPSVAGPFEELLGRLGAQVRPVPVPDAADLADVYRVVQSAEAVAVHHERMSTRPDLYEPETLDRLREATRIEAWEYAAALRRLGELRARAVHRLGGVDALVLPTVPITAPPLGVRETRRSVRAALLSLCTPWSVLGLPAVSVPLKVSGLPVGAQLVGLPGGDEELLDLAASVEDLR